MFDSAQGDDEMAGLDGAAAAAAVSAAHRDILEREGRLFRLAAHWADLHGPAPGPDRVSPPTGGQPVRLGGAGTPEIVEFAAEEFGARLETTTRAAESMIADALDVRHRLPQLWELLTAGGVRVWRVRKVAQATRHLTLLAAGLVDAAVVGRVGVLAWGRFEGVLEAAVIAADPQGAEERARMWEADRFVRATQSRGGLKTLLARANAGDVMVFMATLNRITEILAERGDTDTADVRRSTAVGILAQPACAWQLLWDHRNGSPAPDLPIEPGSESEQPEARSSLSVLPPGVDPDRLKPPVVLYVRVSNEALTSGVGVARFEDVGPVALGQVRRWLAGAGCDLRVQPVVDLADDTSVDAYEVPRHMREQQLLRSPASCFPYSPAASRRMDLDHTDAYLAPDRGGPPGQTRLGNLGPLTRHEHRAKTHSKWRVRQPEPDTFVWRSPYGAQFLVTRAGTLNLGDTFFGRAVWQAARPTVARPERVSGPIDYCWQSSPLPLHPIRVRDDLALRRKEPAPRGQVIGVARVPRETRVSG